jgi:hypothetical protein
MRTVPIDNLFGGGSVALTQSSHQRFEVVYAV